MPPDVDVYAAAVAGRALASRCRGGYTAQPVPETQYYFPYKSPPRATGRVESEVTRQSDWDGGAFGVAGPRHSGVDYRELSPRSLFQPISGRVVYLKLLMIPRVSTTQGPFQSARIASNVIDNNSEIVLRAYNLPSSSEPVAEMTFTQVGSTESLAFTANGIEGYELTVSSPDYITPSTSLDQAQAISGFTLAGVQAPGPAFDFYGRLEGGVGSLLEVDEDGTQTEVQTALMTVRHDNRFRVGDWIAILEQPDFGYQIHSIEDVGRLKWQTLTLKQEALA